ncbi:MAG: serine/threonine-protein kinase, partial [Myxococcaceae bacterium]
PHLSEEREFVDMFLDEARLSARLQHPHIPQVLDVGLTDGRYYLAIELIEGVSSSMLLRACRRAGALLPMPVVRLCAQGLCDALGYAHDLVDAGGRPLEVVHRDVSPSNLLVSTAGRVLLNDFGIARAQGRSHSTRTGEVKGKFAYMPPEQLDLSSPVDRRADVYSAALTIYELATLESPFLRETEPATIDAVRSGALPDATSARADLTPAFSAALARATARIPGDRFPTARALLDALLDGEVAPPEELGRLVDSLCTFELEVFRRKTSEAITRVTVQTASMLPGGSRSKAREEGGTAAALAALRSPWRRWVWPVALVGLIVSGLAAWTLLPGPESPQLPVAVPVPGQKPLPVNPPAAVEKTVAGAPAAAPSSRIEAPPRRNRPPSGGAAKKNPATAATGDPAKSPAASTTGPAAGAPAGPGFVSLDARPWADVFIDGRQIDRTPIARYPLPPGQYQIVFKNPERQREATRLVTVESGRPTSVLVELE